MVNVKCEHCGYEGPLESFDYLYNIRLEDDAHWHECPKCFGWNMFAHDGERVDFPKLALSYAIHSDKGIGIHADGTKWEMVTDLEKIMEEQRAGGDVSTAGFAQVKKDEVGK